MRTFLPCLAGLLLWMLHGASAQSNDPLDQFVSQALSVYTEVVSFLSAQATATTPITTAFPTPIASATSSASTASTISTTSAASATLPISTTSTTSLTSISTRPSTLTTSTRAITSVQSASNSVEAAAASSSSSVAAPAASTNAQNNKNRTIGIVLGVVLGLLALALIIGLILLCLRRRRRRRRQAVGSKRSISPEDVGRASWGKEPLSSANSTGFATSGRFSTHEPHRAPIGAATPLMADNSLHNHDHGALGSAALIPHRGAPNFQPGQMDESIAGSGPHRPSPTHIPFSSHSRSKLAAAGLGGAALGRIAAKRHDDKHNERDYQPHSNEHGRSISRKPIPGAYNYRPASQSPESGLPDDSTPVYEAYNARAADGLLKSPSQSPTTISGIQASSSPSNGNPPSYHGSSHPLSSHPPFAEKSPNQTNHHSPLVASAAGALGGASLGHYQHRDARWRNQSDAAPALNSRRSWDLNRQARNPHSILANAPNRRSTGSTNPYVQPRTAGGTARFSDEDLGRDQSHSPHSPQPIRAGSFDQAGNGSPRSGMPGGWRGSWESERNGNSNSNRGDFTNDAALQPSVGGRNRKLDAMIPEEEEGWYRGRYMGDGIRSGLESGSGIGPGIGLGDDGDLQGHRFYANATRESGRGTRG